MVLELVEVVVVVLELVFLLPLSTKGLVAKIEANQFLPCLIHILMYWIKLQYLD